jgi:transposase
VRPVLQVPQTHDHLSVIGALTRQGRLLTQVQARAYNGADVVRFLGHLLRHLRGKLLVIWDGAPIHRAEEVKAFLAAGGARWIHLEQLPGYAPDLNPVEGIWRQLKQVELKNVCCHDFIELRRQFRRALGRLRHKRKVLHGCIKQAGY